jgi:hypothetical protein
MNNKLKKYFEDGEQAFRDGIQRNACPHPDDDRPAKHLEFTNSEIRNSWLRGHCIEEGRSRGISA